MSLGKNWKNKNKNKKINSELGIIEYFDHFHFSGILVILKIG